MFVVVATTPVSPALADLPRNTCKATDPNFNTYEDLGHRPDLCTSGSGLYPAPDCRFYIRCNDTRAMAAKCPAGFLFDTTKRQCDWPHKIESCSQLCQENYVPPTKSTTTSPVMTTTVHPASSAPLIQSTSTTTTTTTTATTSKSTSTLPPRDPLCKNVSGNFEYQNDCTKYVSCKDWHAILHDCPKGLVFVAAKGWCNWTWMLPEQHRCYKAFDNGSGDCPFYRGENDTAPLPAVASTAVKPIPMIY
ncbi:hypothetical protein RvY_00262-2 [Ramazzottius varieornatus]|nr:hypothetical protein RvY_00262-2 [Ramazzottius varieornatus]